MYLSYSYSPCLCLLQGFVIVSALLVTAALEVVVEGKPPSGYAIAALPLVVTSTIIHQKYPYKAKPKKE